jgi:PAS domain S-box-containing protein
MEGIKTLNVAIVGGGPGCEAIMDMIFAEKLSQLRMKLIGVACTNTKAVGYLYAQKKGIHTAKDYRDFYELKDLDMIIELTGRDEVAWEISRTKPDRVRLVDHVTARLFWDIFQIEEQRIEERRISEEERRESEERLKAILNTIHAGVVLIDAETHRIVDVNPIAAELIGVPKEKIVGHVCHTFICPAQEGRCPITDLGQTVDKSERVLINAERKSIPILKTVTPMVLAGRKYLIDSFIDLTERKHLEAQFQQAQKMQAIGTLAGGIAHDFNNLLMAIQGHEDLIAMDIQPSHAHFKHLKEIERAVEQGRDLTKQLLGFARGGKYEVKLTNLNILVAQSCEMYGRTHKEIKIHTKKQREVWPVEVDRAQIEQVLLNLYVNAWQAMPDGGDLYVETDNVVLDEDNTKPFEVEPGRYVRISVTDTGVGMDKETQQRVFDPFFTTKEVDRGTGLGLSSAYGIIKNHGGLINVYSEEGKGSTFNIYLPATDGQFPLIEKRDSEREEILTGTETVLLVDDEDMVLTVGDEILRKMGYKVLLAKSGREAIEIYRKHRSVIDIIILDMIMPDMGGGESYDIMKQEDAGVKVLLSSGYSIDGQASQILERGCDGFIQKPFKIKELSGKIRQILDDGSF